MNLMILCSAEATTAQQEIAAEEHDRLVRAAERQLRLSQLRLRHTEKEAHQYFSKVAAEADTVEDSPSKDSAGSSSVS